MSKQTFVAMRYSHERSAKRPSKRSYALKARMNVSCKASSASAEHEQILVREVAFDAPCTRPS